MTETSKGRQDYYSNEIHASGPDAFAPVELPTEEVFEEVQPFDLAWLWMLLGIEVLVIFIPLIVAGTPWWTILMVAVFMALILSLLSATNLQTRMDYEGVHYRMKPFHLKPQFIPWEKIDMIQVRPYNPLREDGGYGLRVRRNRKAYNVGSRHCIAIVTKEGKHVVIGTQDPESANAFLSRRPMMV